MFLDLFLTDFIICRKTRCLSYHMSKFQFSISVIAKLKINGTDLTASGQKIRFQFQYTLQIVDGKSSFAQSQINGASFEICQIV